MASVFNCSACQQVISVDAEPGMTVECPLCHQMIAVPTGMSPEMQPTLMSYASARSFGGPLQKGTAIGAMVCSLIGLFGCPLLGVVGIILGIIALNKCKSNPCQYGGRGMAIAGISIGGANFITLALLIAIFFSSAARARELSKRANCAANLRGIGQAMYIYAQDEPQVFPALGGPSTLTSGNMHLCFPADRTTPATGKGIPSPTVDMWELIRENNTSSSQFVCPSTTDVRDSAVDTSAYYDFASLTNLSYAYQYQHDSRFKAIGPSSPLNFPIMADANPFIKGGVPGNSFAADRVSNYRGNSDNHTNREGQNVLFVDGHVSFEKGPDVGMMGNAHPSVASISRMRDHCYTFYSSTANSSVDPGHAAPTLSGGVGTCILGGRSDACLVP